MKGVVKLILCIIGLYLTVTVVVPWINKAPLLEGVQQTVRRWDINCAAFFYTDEISSNPEIKKHTDL